MVKKQKTFESKYTPSEQYAIEWLLNLSKCFHIKKVQIKTYTKKQTKFFDVNCCRVVVEYE